MVAEREGRDGADRPVGRAVAIMGCKTAVPGT